MGCCKRLMPEDITLQIPWLTAPGEVQVFKLNQNRVEEELTRAITVPAPERGLLAFHFLFILCLTQLNFPNALVVNLLYEVWIPFHSYTKEIQLFVIYTHLDSKSLKKQCNMKLQSQHPQSTSSAAGQKVSAEKGNLLRENALPELITFKWNNQNCVTCWHIMN